MSGRKQQGRGRRNAAPEPEIVTWGQFIERQRLFIERQRLILTMLEELRDELRRRQLLDGIERGRTLH